MFNFSYRRGIVICVKDEHPEKVNSLISVIDEGISICLINEQPEKASLLIKVTLGGIKICLLL